MKINTNSFTNKIICDNELYDSKTEIVTRENEFDLFITAEKDRPKFIELKWDCSFEENELILGDAWERTYGNLCFSKPNEISKSLPWYFAVTNKSNCLCFGVKTGCNSFVGFKVTPTNVTALVDCRNGGNGVHLNGRKIKLATFIKAEYDNGNIIENLHDYCKMLCSDPLLPNERIYGGNNWYYAYGKSNYKQIISDAKLQVELSQGIPNKPFQVIDDCWQPKRCAGPWIPNRKFKDMEKLAREIKESGARPGIWVRLLFNKDRKLKKQYKILRNNKRQYLDPTVPEVQAYIKADLERIKGWGYELIKHDFSTADLFGDYGASFEPSVPRIDNWHFHDKTKTNAEIVLDFYRLIKESAGDMLIIGCNTFSHLCAGLVHINRTGDDTSGREWARTRDMGVNTLAFRLAQNEAFYMCDADCVGILKEYIPWKKNKQWLHLLSYSNTPLFISCTDEISDEKKNDIKKAYITFNERHSFKPVDIYDTKIPSVWEIDNKTVNYNW